MTQAKEEIYPGNYLESQFNRSAGRGSKKVQITKETENDRAKPSHKVGQKFQQPFLFLEILFNFRDSLSRVETRRKALLEVIEILESGHEL